MNINVSYHRWLLGCIIFICYSSPVFTQEVNAVVADKTTKQPIADVFIFLGSSSIGTISDTDGSFQISIKEAEQATLVFSHLNYELLTIALTKQTIKQDTFYLVATGIDLEEIQVTKKAKSRVRAKRLRKFKEAFIGTSKETKDIKIINPEVLLFEEENKKLVATTSQPLIIENKLLGYQLDFYLKTFELNLINEDVFYKGSPFFKPLESNRRELARYKKNRKKIYQKTSRKFFSDLVANTLNQEAYELGFAALDRAGKVVQYEPIPLDSLQIDTLQPEKYIVSIKGYFAVTDATEIPTQQAATTKLDANFYSGIKSVKRPELITATSYLKSNSNKIILNQYGVIVNQLEIEEYGFWSDQRIAFLLPLDYRE